MIKRQFYSLEHRSRDSEASSESSTSSSAHEGAASSDDEAQSSALEQEDEEACFPGSDPEVLDEGSDGNKDSICDLAPGENDLDKTNDDDEPYPKIQQKKKQKTSKPDLSNQWADLVAETLNEEAAGFADECVVSCKKVLKCRVCPKTVCLSRETMQAHLVSKKHARSLKLMSEGRLRVMLNSDGDEEEQGETHAERHARVLASFKSEQKEAAKDAPKRKALSGRQRQRRRVKKKAKKSKNG